VGDVWIGGGSDAMIFCVCRSIGMLGAGDGRSNRRIAMALIDEFMELIDALKSVGIPLPNYIIAIILFLILLVRLSDNPSTSPQIRPFFHEFQDFSEKI